MPRKGSQACAAVCYGRPGAVQLGRHLIIQQKSQSLSESFYPDFIIFVK
jgi:hypothetical protein